MNTSLDILNNPNKTFENDLCIINLITEEIIWKAGMFFPHIEKNIVYWFNKRKQLNAC